MTPARFNAVCKALPHTTYVCQWGGSHVWKIGGKVFAIGSPVARGALHVTFKCSAVAFEILKDAAGCRPAPYLASRGMLWIQRTGPGVLDARGLAEHLAASYELVAEGLSKTKRRELGLDATPPTPTDATTRTRRSRPPGAPATEASAGTSKQPGPARRTRSHKSRR